MNYYYFAASLPMPSLQTPPPISYERFRELCEQHLSRIDLKALDELMEPATGDSRHWFVKEWRNRETQLRNAVAKIRAARLRRDAGLYLKEQEGLDTHVEKSAADAFSKKTPLDRELALDRFRWHQIEDAAGYDAFSITAILAYALKLALAQRWAAMDREKGKGKFEELVQQGPEQ